MSNAPSRGFTLIELLVVLLVAGLVATLAMPNFHRALPGMQMRAGASDLANALREARSAAIHEGREATVAIDVERNRYRLRDWRALPEEFRITLRTASRERLEAGTGQLRFYPDGTATGGQITMAAADGGEYRITVDWLTGRVEVLD